MPLAKSRLRRTFVPPALALPLLWHMPLAQAEGGFPEPGFVQQSQRATATSYSRKGEAVSADSVTITASGPGYSLTSTTGGVSAAVNLSTAVALWDTTAVQTSVPASVTVDSSSASASFTKGGASLSAGKSVTQATIVIDGRPYVVARELAMAFARATQFGSSSAVQVEGTLTFPGSGSSCAPVAASKGGSR
jgi:hypothetical protein